MTMLDRMRRHKSWLKWSLAIVVVSFVLLYIPSFLNESTGGAASNSVVAEVEGRDITAAQFRRVYNQQMQAYRQSYGANIDDRLLKQLGIDQRIVQQMIQEEASLAEAKRLGITASDAEVRERIVALPAFQDNGQFIGDQRYRALLRMQTPPMRPDEFEDQIRRSIISEKLQAALTAWITVDDADVMSEYKKRYERVKLQVVNLPAAKYHEGLTATDAEVNKYFEDHKDAFRVSEKRKVRYLLIDQEALRKGVTVTGQQLERYYNDNIQRYATPEQVKASHILLKTEGKDDAAVRKQAEDILAKLKGGADFAELAKKYSEDTGSAVKGGDLDYFGKGQMVSEFDKVAFSLQPGQMSDLVKTQFGYHIIKLVDKRPASQKTFAEVRPQIEDQLKYEQAQTAAQKLSDQVAGELKRPSDFDSVARKHSLQTGESGLFLQDEPVAGIGMAPGVNQKAFDMKEGEVSEPLQTPGGYAFITVTGHQDPYIPKVDEVRVKVRDEVLNQKAIEAARQKAAAIAPSLKSGDFEKAAKDAGLEAKTTDMISRSMPIGDAGVGAQLETTAFSLPVGAVSDPIVTEHGAAILKVLERKDATPEEFAKQKDSLRADLLNEKKNKFFSAYMTKARQKMKININRETIAQIVT